MGDDRSPLTADEVKKYFEEFISRLHESARSSLESEKQISDYVGALHMFDTYYDRLLQNYYESIEVIEQLAKNKGTRFESDNTPQYIKAWNLIKEITLVKQRWRKRKKPF